MEKNFLLIEIGNATHLQLIKDAMVQAIFQKMDATGIPDAQDQHYAVWQAIYLQAHYQATNER